jgi:hypothetical protein
MKRLLGLLVGAMLAIGVAQAPAQAATINLDVNSGTPTAVGFAAGAHLFGLKITLPPLHFSLGGSSAFKDIVKIVLTSTTNFADLAVSTASNFNVASLTYKLYSNASLSMASLMQTGTSLSLAHLAAGTYFLKISGSTWFGSYATKVTANIAATPIPASLLMLGTALGGLGFAGYRRRKVVAA